MANEIGRYRLQREVGRGAAGSVWVAWDTQLERQVAIKRLHADSPDEAAQLTHFKAEARAIARLRSLNIVRVYDVGTSGGQPFLVMELLEGESLEARLVRHTRLPLSMCAEIISDVCQGLSATHRAGIIHRDVKPANVFLTRETRRDVAKLLDFGVATLMAQSRACSHDEGLNGHWVGTPQYTSPEQLEGESVDGRSDLWSLAIMAYRMLTGVCPFQATTLPSLRARIGSGCFTAPSSLLRELDSNIDDFFRRALARSPGERFQRAEEFSNAFSALCRERPQPTRILFLDDEPDMELLVRQRFRRQVRDGQYELHFALDGRRGLDELKQGAAFDVIVTDLNMPGMDGLSFLGQVPELDPLVRVVVLSAYGDMPNIRAAMNRGAFDFLGKPIDFDDLQATIEKCAAHASMVRKALQSTEENQMMRALLGQGVADRWLAALRNAESALHEATRATVVFVDIHGFARTLSQPLPEHAFERLNEHFALFIRELQAKEGTVSRFVGDAVLAIFEGDGHLRRALDACLAIRVQSRARVAEGRAESGESFGVAIGVDTGLIMRGPAGSAALGHVEPSLIGDPVSTAARLQGMAERDEVLIAACALREVADDYQCEQDARRTVPTRGGVEPVACVVRKHKSLPSVLHEPTAAVMSDPPMDA